MIVDHRNRTAGQVEPTRVEQGPLRRDTFFFKVVFARYLNDEWPTTLSSDPQFITSLKTLKEGGHWSTQEFGIVVDETRNSLTVSIYLMSPEYFKKLTYIIVKRLSQKAKEYTPATTATVNNGHTQGKEPSATLKLRILITVPDGEDRVQALPHTRQVLPKLSPFPRRTSAVLRSPVRGNNPVSLVKLNKILRLIYMTLRKGM